MNTDFTPEEKVFFEETKQIVADNRLFLFDFMSSKNRGISLVSTLYFVFGAFSLFLGKYFFSKFTDWFFVPVGLIFLIVGILARSSFGDAKLRIKAQLNLINDYKTRQRALQYYRLKLFYSCYKTKTIFNNLIEISLVLAVGQIVTTITRHSWNSDASVVAWALIAAMYLALMEVLKELIKPTEEYQLNKIIKIVSKL